MFAQKLVFVRKERELFSFVHRCTVCLSEQEVDHTDPAHSQSHCLKLHYLFALWERYTCFSLSVFVATIRAIDEPGLLRNIEIIPGPVLQCFVQFLCSPSSGGGHNVRSAGKLGFRNRYCIHISHPTKMSNHGLTARLK